MYFRYFMIFYIFTLLGHHERFCQNISHKYHFSTRIYDNMYIVHKDKLIYTNIY